MLLGCDVEALHPFTNTGCLLRVRHYSRQWVHGNGKDGACSVAQSCPTPCDPMDCSPPGSSVYGIFQARILEWIAISSSTGSSQLRDRTGVSCVFCLASRFFASEPPGKPCFYGIYVLVMETGSKQLQHHI